MAWEYQAIYKYVLLCNFGFLDAWYGSTLARRRVFPNRMFRAFTNKSAAMLAQVLQ
jgi:hypothetical protein